MFEIATTVSETNKAFYYIFGVSTVFTLGITAVMIYFVIRYSRKRNPVPTNIEGSLALEITWTVIPTILAMGMFYYGWESYLVQREVPQGATEVEAQARKYSWAFRYENGKITPELFASTGRPLKVSLVSADVIHSFYIPAYRVKEDVVPGQTNYVTFTPLRPGIYDIFCTEFCGVGHSAMNSRLTVLRPKEFDDWLNSKEAQKPLDMKEIMAGSERLRTRGAKVFATYCASCHGKFGKGEALPEARDFTKMDDWKNGTKISQMFRSVTKGVGKKMPSFVSLTPEDRFAAIHNIRAFAKGHDRDSAEEIQALDIQYKLSKGTEAPPEIPLLTAMEKIAAETDRERATPPLMLIDETFEKLRAEQAPGATLYAKSCAACHGDRGQGRSGLLTLDAARMARFGSLSLITPGAAWRSMGVDTFRGKIGKSALATGGLKPAFSTFSSDDWNVLFAFCDRLLPEGKPGEATK